MCNHVTYEDAHQEHLGGGVTHTCPICKHDLSTGTLGDYWGAVNNCLECFPEAVKASYGYGMVRQGTQYKYIDKVDFNLDLEIVRANAEYERKSDDRYGFNKRHPIIGIVSVRIEACDQLKRI